MVVIITGMHRSGTSLVAGLLNKMGLWLGENLTPPDSFNPKGYFEDKEVWQFNEEMLNKRGGTWHTPVEIKEVLKEEKEKMNKIIARLSVKTPWGMKDPRFCVTLNAWLEVLPIPPFIVICERHPAAVIKSLECIHKIDPKDLLNLYFYYVTSLHKFLFIYNLKFITVNYEALISNPIIEIERLGEILGLNINKEAIEFVDKMLNTQGVEYVFPHFNASYKRTSFLYRLVKDEINSLKNSLSFFKKEIKIKNKEISKLTRELHTQKENLENLYNFAIQIEKDIHSIITNSRSPLPDWNAQYKKFAEKTKLKEEHIRKMKVELEYFGYKPLISVIMPVFNPKEQWLKDAIESVLNQIYPYWELCICDDGSTSQKIHSILREYANKDNRIKVVFLQENTGISNASNVALSMADGEFIALLDHDDELSPNALFEVVRLLQQNPDADIIYSDEDKIDEKGELCDPFFKPDWSPDLFFSMMYIGHLGVYRKKLVEEVGGFRKEFEGAQDYDLVLRLLDKTTNIYHIPKVLYHWRKTPHSTAYSENAKPYVHDVGKRALQNYFIRNKIEAEVVDHPKYVLRYKVIYKIKHNPLVTIIIPTRDQKQLLQNCIQSIQNKTTYPNYEIVIIDHDSQEYETKVYLRKLSGENNIKILKYKGDFNHSKMCNMGVLHAKGEYVIFLNNDIEVISPEWIEEMLMHAQRKCVGVVGAKLLYPDRTLQHAGVILGLRGVAGHSHKHFPDDHPGYFNFPHLIRNYSAVTGACMMIRKEIFEEVGGFDEENLPTTFNDVDLCLKVRKRGYWIVYTPYAILFHHEGQSRGHVAEPHAIEFMKKKWGDVLDKDPFYNPNLTLNSEDFSLRNE